VNLLVRTLVANMETHYFAAQTGLVLMKKKGEDTTYTRDVVQ